MTESSDPATLTRKEEINLTSAILPLATTETDRDVNRRTKCPEEITQVREGIQMTIPEVDQMTPVTETEAENTVQDDGLTLANGCSMLQKID